MLLPLASVGIVALLLTLAGCGERSRTPHTPPALVDGLLSQPAPRELEQLGQTAVLTRVRTLTATTLSRRDRSCVRAEAGGALRATEVAVERVDALGSSLTFRLRGERFVHGCTSGGAGQAPRSDWCGHMEGKLRHGRLTDPRLDILCRTHRGEPVGSVWIDPVRGARWVVVRDTSRVQIYPTAGSLPVRVTTTTVDLQTATAVFRVEQYDGSGARIAEATIRAAVAG
jgi:hypothetical protein